MAAPVQRNQGIAALVIGILEILFGVIIMACSFAVGAKISGQSSISPFWAGIPVSRYDLTDLFVEIYGWHQIWEFREKQGIWFSIRESHRKRMFGKKSGNPHVSQCFIQSSDFLYTQSHIQLSVIAAKFKPFVDHSVLCSHY